MFAQLPKEILLSVRISATSPEMPQAPLPCPFPPNLTPYVFYTSIESPEIKLSPPNMAPCKWYINSYDSLKTTVKDTKNRQTPSHSLENWDFGAFEFSSQQCKRDAQHALVHPERLRARFRGRRSPGVPGAPTDPRRCV